MAIELSLISAVEVDNKEIDNNDVTASPGNVDTNLQAALLKALKDLESEEPHKAKYFDKDNNSIVEKASASAVSILTRNDALVVSSTPSANVTERVTSTEKPFVLLQKSEGEHKLTISSFEKFKEPEQIDTSATSSFVLSKQDIEKTNHNSKGLSSPINSIEKENKIATRAVFETTTSLTTTSTEESEAKVENVQFFSAPLVAAFTVHQDELGLPNKVESIFKAAVNNQNPTPLTTQEKTKNENLLKNKEQQQYEIQQKQKSLEDQILKLNYNLKQQQLAFQQQFNDQQQNLKYNSVIESQDKINFNHVSKVQEELRLQQQIALQQKQKALEEEIVRLNSKLKQQQLNWQQQVNLQQRNLQQQQNIQQQNLQQQNLQQQNLQQQKLQQQNLQQPNIQLQNFQPLNLQQHNLQQQYVQQQNLKQEKLQQQQQFLLQQEQLRLASRQLSPISHRIPLNLGESVFSTVQQLPIKEAQKFSAPEILTPSSNLLQPSISFNSINEAGQLPLNGQFLPIKGPVNFHSSPIGQPTFQSFSAPALPLSSIVQPNVFQQQLPLVSNIPQGVRILRQETGVGNFGNQAFKQPSNSFSIQKSIVPTQFTESTLIRTNIGQETSNHLEPNRNQHKQNQVPSFSSSVIHPQITELNPGNSRNRFFRSNLESTLVAPGHFYSPYQNNHQWNTFLPNSGGLRGRFFP